MATEERRCGGCGAAVIRKVGQFRPGPAYCSLACFGKARRTSKAEKVARKAAYDALYRTANAEKLRIQKQDHHRRTYDAERARAARAAKLSWHRAYIREYNAKPENRARKQQYDEALRRSEYGDFADAWRLLLQLEREIRRMVPDGYERLKMRGYFDRVNEKKREARKACRNS